MSLQEQLRSKMAIYQSQRKAELGQCDQLFTNEIIRWAKGHWLVDAADNGENDRVTKAKYLNLPSYCLTTAVITKPQEPIEGVKVTTETAYLVGDQPAEINIRFSW